MEEERKFSKISILSFIISFIPLLFIISVSILKSTHPYPTMSPQSSFFINLASYTIKYSLVLLLVYMGTVILEIIGMLQTKKKNLRGFSLSLAGLVISIASLIYLYIFYCLSLFNS
jgi:hypothetical protein